MFTWFRSVAAASDPRARRAKEPVLILRIDGDGTPEVPVASRISLSSYFIIAFLAKTMPGGATTGTDLTVRQPAYGRGGRSYGEVTRRGSRAATQAAAEDSERLQSAEAPIRSPVDIWEDKDGITLCADM